MNIQQQMKLKLLMGYFECDYRLAEQLHARQVELQESVKPSDLEDVMDRALIRAGVRDDVLAAAKESVEFEETLAAMVSELTGIIGRWDMADKLDSERLVS